MAQSIGASAVWLDLTQLSYKNMNRLLTLAYSGLAALTFDVFEELSSVVNGRRGGEALRQAPLRKSLPSDAASAQKCPCCRSALSVEGVGLAFAARFNWVEWLNQFRDEYACRNRRCGEKFDAEASV